VSGHEPDPAAAVIAVEEARGVRTVSGRCRRCGTMHLHGWALR
jgi:hypothetical protein